MARKGNRKGQGVHRDLGRREGRTVLPLHQLCNDTHHLRRAGWAVVSIQERDVPVDATSREPYRAESEADRFVQGLGLRPLGYTWLRVDGENARIIARHLLRQDLAYRQPLMTGEEAAGLAKRFFAFLPGSHWYGTNIRPGNQPEGKRLDPDRLGDGWGWNSLTEHTFDGGVVAINATHIGILCFADED